MTRRRLLFLFGVVAATLLVALGAANAAYGADAGSQTRSRHAVASERVGTHEVGVHAAVIKTKRSERLLRLGFAVLGGALVAVALRRARTRAVHFADARLGFAVGALGRGPPVLRVR